MALAVRIGFAILYRASWSKAEALRVAAIRMFFFPDGSYRGGAVTTTRTSRAKTNGRVIMTKKQLKERDQQQRLATYGALERLQNETNIPANELGNLWKLSQEAIDNEPQAIELIKKHILTEPQRQLLFDHNMSIEDMLNGRIAGEERQAVEATIYAEWNTKLGYQAFGY